MNAKQQQVEMEVQAAREYFRDVNNPQALSNYRRKLRRIRKTTERPHA